MMLKQACRSLALLVSTAVAVPYTIALVCNIVYGWPQSKHKFQRAFNPKKVYKLNYVLLKTIFSRLRYSPMWWKWRKFYTMADKNLLIKDIPFGRNDKALDLYFPVASRRAGNKPVVVFVFGGGWSLGDKNMYGLVCYNLANKLDAIVCCPNYSLYPQGYIDDMIQDVVDAVAWTFENVHLYGGDKDKLMLIGHSAGAHLCMMSVLELLHDLWVPARASAQYTEEGAVSTIQFSEGHFDTDDSGDNNAGGRHGASGASSVSFDVLHANDDQRVTVDGAGDSIISDEQKTLDSGIDSNIGSFIVVGQSSGEQVSQPSTAHVSRATSQTSSVEVLDPREIAPSQNSDTESGKCDMLEDMELLEEDEESEDSEESDQTDSAKPAVIDRRPTLVNLGKSIKAVVGMSGVYDIADHYLHEMSRGVEDVSPMYRCMYGPDYFARFSPTVIVKNQLNKIQLPDILLVHAGGDAMVPVSSTQRFANVLKNTNSNVTVHVIRHCSHIDLCFDMMQTDRRFSAEIMDTLTTLASQVF